MILLRKTSKNERDTFEERQALKEKKTVQRELFKRSGERHALFRNQLLEANLEEREQ